MIENFNANSKADASILDKKLSQEAIDLMDKKDALNNIIWKKKESDGKCDFDKKCLDLGAPIYPNEEKPFDKMKDGGSKFGDKDANSLITEGGDKEDLSKPEGLSDGGPKKPEEPVDGGIKDSPAPDMPEGDGLVDPGFQDLRYDVPEEEQQQPRDLEAYQEAANGRRLPLPRPVPIPPTDDEIPDNWG